MHVDDPEVGKNIRELSEALARADDGALIEAFLQSLLTPAELADIAARWALVKELDRKTPQREIARKLGLSLCKITRGSRELKKPNSPFRAMFNLIQSPPERNAVPGPAAPVQSIPRKMPGEDGEPSPR
ncbi:Trp family transcriptional regulator [Treponema sp. J25]|uniref:Trp family transcriptional regulator n=1 Tax=Treponema sp. J25 TaxID=2094121 RepID=UPI0010517A4F|nr:transcriptional regulator [Treponema sp. J25]